MTNDGRPQSTQDASPPRPTAAGGTRFAFVLDKGQAGTRSHAMREHWRARRRSKLQNKQGRSGRELRPKVGPSEGQIFPAQRVQIVDSESTDRSVASTEQGELPVIRDVGAPAQFLAGFNHALAASRLDPFDSFPVTLTSEHHKLMHHWLSTHATMMFESMPTSNFNPMREVWFPLDLSNVASFNCVMAHSAAHLAYFYGGSGPFRGTDSAEALGFKTHAVRTLNKWLGDQQKALSNDAFIAVVRLLTFERYWGTAEEWRIHRKGLQSMINARGGLDGLRENWRLELVVALISLMSEPSWFNPANNISEISRYHIRNHLLGTDVDIHKIRSLWLVSFVQDMRTLMSLSSNLYIHGVALFPSVYDAIHLVRTNFELEQQVQKTAYSASDHNRLACLLAIAVMVQGTLSAVDTPLSSGMNDLAVLDMALAASRHSWESSIHGLVAIIHAQFITIYANGAQKLEYIQQMTDVISRLSLDAQIGVEKCLLNMLCRKRDGRLFFPADGGWTPDSLLSSLRGE